MRKTTSVDPKWAKWFGERLVARIYGEARNSIDIDGASSREASIAVLAETYRQLGQRIEALRANPDWTDVLGRKLVD